MDGLTRKLSAGLTSKRKVAHMRNKSHRNQPYHRNGATQKKQPRQEEANTDCKVFVMNFDYSTSWQELRVLFQDAGNVLRVQLLKDENGRSRGRATVEFSTAEEAVIAIDMFDGFSFNGRDLRVMEAVDRKKRAVTIANDDDDGDDGDDVEELDAEEVEDIDASDDEPVIIDPPPRTVPKTKGFSRASSSGSAEAVSAAALESIRGRQLLLRNIPTQTPWYDLRDLFRPFGNVIRVDILYHPDGKPRGAATILFASVGDMQHAAKLMHGKEYRGLILDAREDTFDQY